MLAYSVEGTALANATRFIVSADDAFGVRPERGEDLLIPGAEGEEPLPRVKDVAFDEFVMRVNGVTTAGVWPSDESAQFLTNLLALQALLRPSSGDTITVTKTLTTAAGAVVLGPSECRCVSDLAPRMEAPWTGLVLVRLKVYDGWSA